MDKFNDDVFPFPTFTQMFPTFIVTQFSFIVTFKKYL